MDSDIPEIAEPVFHHVHPWDKLRLLENEKATIAMYVSGDPMDCYSETVAQAGITRLSESVPSFEEYEKSHSGASGKIFAACIVREGKYRTTRKKTRMYTGELEDGDTLCDVVVFSKALERGNCTLEEGKVMAIAGTISRHEGRVQIAADEALLMPDDSLGESMQFGKIVGEEMKRLGYRKKRRSTKSRKSI